MVLSNSESRTKESLAMQNPAEDSTTADHKSLSSSPQRPPNTDTLTPTTQNSGGTTEPRSEGSPLVQNTRIPRQVAKLELTSSVGDGSGFNDQNGSSVAMKMEGSSVMVEGGGGSTQVAVAVGNLGQQMALEDPIMSEGLGKKRKPSQLSDPPPGPPTCPICQKEFSSWRAAFGHMNKHPGRGYRGFFKPPVFSSASPTRRVDDQGDGEESSTSEEQNCEEGSSPASRGVEFDLNQPMERMEPSDGAQRNELLEYSDVGEKNIDERNIVGFDLNELPPSEEDEDN